MNSKWTLPIGEALLIIALTLLSALSSDWHTVKTPVVFICCMIVAYPLMCIIFHCIAENKKNKYEREQEKIIHDWEEKRDKSVYDREKERSESMYMREMMQAVRDHNWEMEKKHISEDEFKKMQEKVSQLEEHCNALCKMNPIAFDCSGFKIIFLICDKKPD